MATTYPQQREMAPDFVLPSPEGKPYQLSSYRGRRNLVLVFAGEASREALNLLQDMARRKDEFDFEEAQIFVIVQADCKAAEALCQREAIPFAVLADADGTVHQRYGAGRPALVLTDRYGEIYEADREQLPSADEVLASLRHINAACPE